ncbi:unnamed protein product [Chrysoparadoxa australica]
MATALEVDSLALPPEKDIFSECEHEEEEDAGNVVAVAHVLDMSPEAAAERKAQAADLAAEMGVLPEAALAAIESFGCGSPRVEEWLQECKEQGLWTAHESEGGELSTLPLPDALSIYGGQPFKRPPKASAAAHSPTALERDVVAVLVGAGRTAPPSESSAPPPAPGHDASDHGLSIGASCHCMDPAEGTDNVNGYGSSCGTGRGLLDDVSALCESDLQPLRVIPALHGDGPVLAPLSNQVDWIMPGNLVTVSSSEGFEPGCSGRRGTIALDGAQKNKGWLAKERQEVLVDFLSQETGMCLPCRVPITDIRQSTTIFGSPLQEDDPSSVMSKVLKDTDHALAIQGARGVLLRLIHAGHIPPVQAAGGPKKLLQLMRLLASQDLATGGIPTVNWSHENTGIDLNATGDNASLLHMLWHRLVDSFSVQTDEELAGMLTQEVLDTFQTLSSGPSAEGMRSGGANRQSGPEPVVMTHESLHPIAAPLSYAGKASVPEESHGLVVKMDARSATSGPDMRLKFFASEADMIGNKNAIRVMYGYHSERAARVKAKHLEFFKVEEADSMIAALKACPVITTTLDTHLDTYLVLMVQSPCEGNICWLALNALPRSLSAGHILIHTLCGARGQSLHHLLLLYIAWCERALLQVFLLRHGPDSKLSSCSLALPHHTGRLPSSSFSCRFDASPAPNRPPIQMQALYGSFFLPRSQGQGGSASDVPDGDLDSEFGIVDMFEESKQKGTSGDSAAQASEASSPACVMTPGDAAVSFGCWCYEVTVVELAVDASIRVGWADSLFAAEVKRNQSDETPPNVSLYYILPVATSVYFTPCGAPIAPFTNDSTASQAGRLAPGNSFQGHACALDQGGAIWYEHLPSQAPLREGDVVSTTIDAATGHVSFAINGVWYASPAPAYGDSLGSGLSVTPCISLQGEASASVNAGYALSRLRFPPQNPKCKAIVECPLLGPASIGSASDGISQLVSSVASKSKALEPQSLISGKDWGFRFQVESLTGVRYQVIQEMELVCRFGSASGVLQVASAETGDVSGATAQAQQPVSIWRPKAPEGWFSVGDVASFGTSPPAGGLVVKGDNTGCLVSKPAKFRLIFQDKATGYTVWRPMPRKGQVTLGDFVCKKKTSKVVMAGAVRCVVAWATTACPVLRRLRREGKQSGSAALWCIQNGLGTFFGSQTGARVGRQELLRGSSKDAKSSGKRERKKKKKKKKKAGDISDEEDADKDRIKLRLGVGQGRMLTGVDASQITNEWSCEADVVMATPGPSISWASWIVSFLLEHPNLKQLVMTAKVFRVLAGYLKAPGAPQKLRIVPLLTLLVRSHDSFQGEGPDLTLLDGLMTEVLKHCDHFTAPQRGSTKPKASSLFAPKALLLLTDLAAAVTGAKQAMLEAEARRDEGEQPQELSPVPVRRHMPRHSSRAGETEDVPTATSTAAPAAAATAGENESNGAGASAPADGDGPGADAGTEAVTGVEADPGSDEREQEPSDVTAVDTLTSSASPCLQYLMEIMAVFRALEDGWPSHSHSKVMDSLLCEAWYDAVGKAVTRESQHPYHYDEEGSAGSRTILFPEATGLRVVLDKRSSLPLGVTLNIQGGNKTFALSGDDEATWGQVLVLHASEMHYEVTKEVSSSVDAQDSDGSSTAWGYGFTVIGCGPIWEQTTLESDHPLLIQAEEGQVASSSHVHIQGAKQLLFSFDSKCALPERTWLTILDGEGTVVAEGLGRGTPNALSPGAKEVVVKGSSATLQLVGYGEGATARYNLSAGDVYDTADDDDDVLEIPPLVSPGDNSFGSVGSNPDGSGHDLADESEAPFTPRNARGTATAAWIRGSSGSNNGAFPTLQLSWPSALTPPASALSGRELSLIPNSPSGPEIGPSLSQLPHVLPSLSPHTPPTAPLPWRADSRSGEGEAGAALTAEQQEMREIDLEARESGSGSRVISLTGAKDVGEHFAAVDGAEEIEDCKGEDDPSLPWGWKVVVQAQQMSRTERLQLYTSKRPKEFGGPTLEEARELMTEWNAELDSSLMEMIGQVERSPTDRRKRVDPWCARLKASDAKFRHVALGSLPVVSLHLRTALFLRLNERIQKMLPVINVSSSQITSLGAQVRAMNHVVLPHVKNSILETALEATQGAGGDCITVTLDNYKASISRDKGERDPSCSQCIFVQGFKQLSGRDPQLLRTLWDGDRVFQVHFAGEDGVDAGGVFSREGITRMVEDLFSPHFDLLIQCPNGRHSTGQNHEKYVPNPQHSSPLALAQFQFMGNIMGISLRTRLCLPFELPTGIWKKLIGLEVGLEDLRAIDTITCQFLTAIRCCEDDNITSEALFEEKYGGKLTFTYTNSAGVEHDLVPGGRQRRVTYSNRHAYCDHVESRSRLREFDIQMAAIVRGMSQVVPMHVLCLYTPQQLEVAVAGSPSFDMEFWRDHTDYKGFRSDDVTIQLFWKVLGSLTPAEQSGFVKFAWGRSRLPPKAYWTCNMKLIDNAFLSPAASHTCFFSVELPEYRTEEEMRKGLLTAIHFGAYGILNA